ncbi:MAG: 23S rRNA (guanosine(2251)-2'-O)-methyltransferase RlmB [Syntrophomonadaceae bacterium]|jgi:23S rRNA (guanosine2251-2'-O)-methyltransferase|nr:23S rRNA (guanosine(2251)-2'-O)-methyltransferase RlmB [Syntrophomonadaceae bacterium]
MKEKLAGINSIVEALKGRRRIDKILVQENRQESKRMAELLQLASKKGVFVQVVEKSRLDKLYTIGNHQGIIALVDAYSYSSLEEVLEYAALSKQAPFLVILDGIEDPRNFGAIVRTAESAGVHGIIVPRHHSVTVNETVARASAGAIEYMPIIQVANLVNTIKGLKEQGMWVIGADMEAKDHYYNLSIPTPTVLVIGGEGKGLKRLVKENCDLLLKIPMKGQMASLNASVAAALLIYEVLRQREVKP